ncbi:GNAT family N-acetyltransferase [Chelatococcus daeguensis]|uniref:GNAT family N-acetyltransferase n=1 Tax=Chelatococcus daeguensis TaxID=444444 RepID=A0AAC9JTR3_9HYPH|nr:N-acetyltransferase [Chelatococcus daeguensis]APF38184.1 GNAT family N-acetyltransferase [Chelatococcus daeguensis]
MTDLKLTIRRELPADAEAVEKLHERAFGPGRFARTAFRLREGVPPLADLSFTALVGTLIVGSVRVSPVMAGEEPALVLGPLTVDPAFENRGIGAALMNASLDAARKAGHSLVLLVGDAPYYARFGFAPVPPGQFTLPGPVDPRRFLACPLQDGVMERARGPVTALRPAR